MTPEAKHRRSEWFRQNNYQIRSAVSTIKLETGCADCGYRVDPAALDFDHINGDKLGPVMRTGVIEKVLAEIDKCEVVCANCHRIRTRDRIYASEPSVSEGA